MPYLEPEQPPLSVALAGIARATDQVISAARNLARDEWNEPSVLPGWTRAHVIAHLALNGEGMSRVLETAGSPEQATVYDSTDLRASDIEQLAGEEPARVLDRVETGARIFDGQLGVGATDRGESPAIHDLVNRGPVLNTTGVDHDVLLGDGVFERTPHGKKISFRELPFVRWRELEIHHADLNIGYSSTDWPAEFVDYLLPLLAYDRSPEIDVELRPTDGHSLTVGKGGDVVRGKSADILWWLLGRGGESSLSGRIPALEPWTRRHSTQPANEA